MKKLFINLLSIVCLIVLCVSVYNVYSTLKEYRKADDVYSEIRDIKEKSEDTNNKIVNNDKDKTENKKDSTKINNKDKKDDKDNTNKLSKLNSDYKFWITVEGTNIDYPVVQGSNNDFYLNHDFNKNYLSSGSIFLDYRNNFETDFNSVIYGHHMRNYTMFGQLEKFKDEEFFDNNKDIILTTENSIYHYEIFAIGVYDANYNYNKTYFKDENDKSNFLNEVTNKAMYIRNIPSSNSQIITLSTCSYEYDNARIAVFAVRK